MNDTQNNFFNALKYIQESSIISSLCDYCREHRLKSWNDIKIDNLNELENLLYDVTFVAISEICTLIDGYTNTHLKLDLIDKNTKKSLRENIELHDICANFLIYEKYKI